MNNTQKVQVIQKPTNLGRTWTMEYDLAMKKEGSANMCNNMDEPRNLDIKLGGAG